MLQQPTIRQRLARTAGLSDLDDATAARLAALAALHDIGKVNVGFQTRIWRPEDLQGKRKPHRSGHVSDLTPILDGSDQETFPWFFGDLGWDEFLQWDNDDGRTVCGLFAAALSHHGRPLKLFGDRQPNPAIWRPFGDLHPRHFMERIGRLVRRWFPDAFAPGANPLSAEPAFQHMFLGLCTLADWIGSNKDYFELCDEPRDDYILTAREKAKQAISDIGLDISSQRSAFRRVPDFGGLFGIDGPPNSIQEAVASISLDQRLAIIESETGSGKTEAALWRFSKLYEAKRVDGIYFALPTRAAATQIHERVNRFISKLFPGNEHPEPVLAVPGYVRVGDAEGKHLQNYEVWWDDHPDVATGNRRWAAESAKQFLAAQIGVGTVDQAMMAALQVKHAHMRAACLVRNLLVVDEVHASDPYMRVILEALLNAHIGAGGYALLMSATLGSAARRRWLFRPQRENQVPYISLDDAIRTDYPAVTTWSEANENVVPAGQNNPSKSVRVYSQPTMHEFNPIAQCALEAARSGAKVLVIRNTVRYAVDTQLAIEEAAGPDDAGLIFSCNGVPTLHTGRFAAEDRRLLDAAVDSQLGKDRPSGCGRVVVGTQTLEQSLDIDADFLITDLCPMDVLLQRIGRLHRHQRNDRPEAYGGPACIVLLPTEGDLSPLLSSGRGGPSRNGLGGFVYPNLRILELTRRLVVEHSESGVPWCIPEMNRELVERATHPEALETLMGPEWTIHANEVEGARIADNITARSAIIRRDKSFLDQEVAFADIEERIRTRLGDEGIEVKFAPEPQSPFDQAILIPNLKIPGHMSRGLTPEESITPEMADAGFEFSVGERRFVYDRLGLRQH